jgi:hypothetical protein
MAGGLNDADHTEAQGHRRRDPESHADMPAMQQDAVPAPLVRRVRSGLDVPVLQNGGCDDAPDHREVMRLEDERSNLLNVMQQALDALLLTPSSGYSMKRDDAIAALRAALGENNE